MSFFSNDFRPTATWDALRLRASMLSRLRSYFDKAGYLEVETPLLSSGTVIDRHLDPFQTTLAFTPQHPHQGPTLYLQTSPELCMKRLLAAGGPNIYQITRSFRNGEAGTLHNPEFTIVEWYALGHTMQDQIQVLGEVAATALAGTPLHGQLHWPAEALSYAQAFENHVGLNPHTATVDDLQQAAQRWQVDHTLANAADRDAWLDLLIVERVQPALGATRPVILYDFPASQAALAQVRTEHNQPAVAERFELYIKGIELANGYHELLAAEVLEDRNEKQNAWRVKDGKGKLPPDERLLDAMRGGLPNCAGVALGFDRLVMLAAEKTKLADVMAFPIERA